MLATIVAAFALVSGPAYASDDPSGLTAQAVSDHAVYLDVVVAERRRLPG